MAHTRRQDQLGELIGQELSDLIHNRLKDPRVGFASITGVEVSGDLRHAKVFVSVMGSADDQQATMQALAHAGGFLRHELAQRLTIRYTPELAFRLDESIARGSHLMELLQQVKEESAARVSDTQTPDAPGEPGTGGR
ncbi:MAG TPA: 30S ribosome-binding factor RbfA [Ktedonobacterales bacterium]|jgi:ribosome-binding factor A